MDSGWIKLFRRLLSWEWFDDSTMVHVLIFCILSANHKEKKWRGHTIKRGQFITSLASISDSTGISTRKIRTALVRLKETGEIDKQSDNLKTLITVCNYDSYQSQETSSDKATDNQTTSERQATDNQTTTTKNEKNVKNEKKETHVTFEIFSYWCEVMRKCPSKSKLTTKRKKAVDARLKEGYMAEDIKQAILNCSQSPFHMGKNDRQTFYNDLELICRSGEKLESFRDSVNKGGPPNNNGSPAMAQEEEIEFCEPDIK